MLINLFNAKNPNGKRIPVTVTMEQIDDFSTKDGEVIYLVTLHTGAIGLNGKKVDPVYLNNITKSTFLNEISKGLSLLSEKINWGTLEEDIYPPNITEIYPKNNDQSVSMSSNVEVHITDPFPASFINKDTIIFKVNGIDVTNQIQLREKNNEVILSWVPIKLTAQD